MSVILVTFPGAPKVSQEAIKKVRKVYENNFKFLSKCVLVRSEKSRCFLQGRKTIAFNWSIYGTILGMASSIWLGVGFSIVPYML